MKAKINSVQVYVNGANVQLTSRKIFYKGEEHYKDVYGDPFIAPNSACGCDVSRQSSDEKMLIMGITEHYRNHVTYMARMSDEKEFRRDLRRIIKGYDCSQYSTSQIQYLGLNNSTGN